MNVNRKPFWCSTFIYVYLVATNTDATSRTTSLMFDRQRHLPSICLVLCRRRYNCSNITIVTSKLRCHIYGEGNVQTIYFLNCSRENETLSGYIEDLSKKKALRQQNGTKDKQVKAVRRDKLSKDQSSKCKGKRKLEYIVDVFTGQLHGAGTSCDIYLMLNGTEGMITQKLQKKDYGFKKGTRSRSQFRAKCVGKLRTIKMRIVKIGVLPSWAWYLEKAEIFVIDGKYTDKYFANPKLWLGEFTDTQSMQESDIEFTHYTNRSQNL